ncbi:hypothetical protein NDA11_005486 [Ustilago hordei]|uniref:CCHC-type domain-containing protein n=1 Tax=Ustilago hordei TaxID=120017 RepID=I2FS46_USTHO|nr:uncharacterized protein UHO2_05858 [Ustilago hordei]KAJ1573238.1 hypothetical protein NDA15_002201 [Ustilago hordei]KAJ1574767.1 hypothetical protein NDA12_003695 [Ustilago hordei]KAJ1576728.1 hypothetical protein NDA11_005486 [Ustilago hordei]CCF49739.1 uncharacterized protein UHOR_13873 [Ustilago hordei]SYW84905.1 uncharacterized protein UHO2_05858 [Ustilago hordei]
MVDDTNPQAGASEAAKRSKRTKKVTIVQQKQAGNIANDDNKIDDKPEYESDDDDIGKQYSFCTLSKLLELVPKLTTQNYYSWSAHIKSFLQLVPYAMEHLEGTYDVNHSKWSCSFDDALTNALHGTIDTIGECNVNYLLLDIIREYLTFHQVWSKIEARLGDEATRTSCWLTLITQLGDIKMFHSNAQKLVQEIRTIQAKGSILGRPFTDDTLFSALQKCMIHHPMFRETVATVHQLSFEALATTLSICQLALESIPTQKLDPQQAHARTASSGDQDRPAQETNSNDSSEIAKTVYRLQKIQCFICRQVGHGARQCNASVSIPKGSPLTNSN